MADTQGLNLETDIIVAGYGFAAAPLRTLRPRVQRSSRGSVFSTRT